MCLELSSIDIPRPVTLISLSTSPGAYLPMLSHILRKYERYHQDHLGSPNEQRSEQQDRGEEGHGEDSTEPQDLVYLPRLFSLCPVPSLKWRFIAINPNVLSAFAQIRLPTTYEAKLEMFNSVFDLTRLKINR